MRNKLHIFSCFLFVGALISQNSTFSPYSRYGLGQLNQQVLTHNAAMGGAHIALKPDSTAPIFINTGNPASYSLIKLTSLEVGGRFLYSSQKGSGIGVNRQSINFSHVALGFPVRGNGGICLGVLPYSFVGYETQSMVNHPVIGDVNYNYSGNGGLSNAFVGYGIMPFNKRLSKFRKKYQYVSDSLKTLSRAAFRFREFNSKWLSDLSLGFNANYIFGNIENISRVIYPNSLLFNNTYRERILYMGDFTGNFGAQTAFTIDSIIDSKGRRKKMVAAIKKIRAMGQGGDSAKTGRPIPFTEEEIKFKTDSILKNTPLTKRALRQKFKIVPGFFMTLNNTVQARYTTAAYNYILSGTGTEILRDTAYKINEQKINITLPLEQGFGLAIKKGERLTIAADFAITNWQNLKYLDEAANLAKNQRVALGFNYQPEKYATGKGTFFNRVNYRFGLSYNSGYVKFNNTTVSDYCISAGLGLPVGPSRYNSSIVNITLQYGQLGFNQKDAIKENYFRVGLGFTYSDRWFQKFRYD